MLALRIRPVLLGSVAVDLDPVALRVAQVEGLADQVVRGAGQRLPRCDDPAQRTRQLEPAGDEDRQMEEPGGSGRPVRGVRGLDELDRRGPVGPELKGPVVVADLAEPDRLLVERSRALAVRDIQAYRARLHRPACALS